AALLRPGGLEDPREVHLDDAVAGRLGELPAANLCQHALLGLGAVERGLRDLTVHHRPGAVDGEEHRHLARERWVPVQLDLVAVLDLALVLLDDAGDHLPRETPHHGGLARDDPDQLLRLPPEVHPAVAARALSHPHGARAADAETFSAATEPHPPVAHA